MLRKLTMMSTRRTTIKVMSSQFVVSVIPFPPPNVCVFVGKLAPKGGVAAVVVVLAL